MSDWAEMREDSWTASNTRHSASETFSEEQDEEIYDNDKKDGDCPMSLPREIGKELSPGAWWYTRQK